MFAKLAAPEHCGVVALQPGDTYAVQNTTRTDSLALLVAGTYVPPSLPPSRNTQTGQNLLTFNESLQIRKFTLQNQLTNINW